MRQDDDIEGMLYDEHERLEYLYRERLELKQELFRIESQIEAHTARVIDLEERYENENNG